MQKNFLIVIVAMLTCSSSLKSEAGDTSPLSEPSKEINVAPIADIESGSEENEAKSKERAQIVKLWDAAFERSPDIKFVVDKFKTDRDSAKIFIESQAMQSISPKTLEVLMQSQIMMIADPSMGDTSYPDLRSVRHDHTYVPLSEKRLRPGSWTRASKTSASKISAASLTTTEQIQLRNMVRSTADKLVQSYRIYVALSRSKNGAVDEHQRARARQDLIDMCGASAVADLDSELKSEMQSN